MNIKIWIAWVHGIFYFYEIQAWWYRKTLTDRSDILYFMFWFVSIAILIGWSL